MTARFVDHPAELPPNFARLRNEAVDHGFRFLARLEDSFLSGRNRFDKSGEVLSFVYDGRDLIGVGGVNIDPYENERSIGRLRHLYLGKTHRRSGYGRALVDHLLQISARSFHLFTLRSDTEAAAAFYEAIGFTRVEGPNRTHERLLRPLQPN